MEGASVVTPLTPVRLLTRMRENRLSDSADSTHGRPVGVDKRLWWSGHRRRGKMEHAGSWGGLQVKQEPRPQPASKVTYTDIHRVKFEGSHFCCTIMRMDKYNSLRSWTGMTYITQGVESDHTRGPLTRLRRPIDGLQLEIIRHCTSREHHFITPDRLSQVPTVLARVILFVFSPESDHQARNDHGRWVFGCMGR